MPAQASAMARDGPLSSPTAAVVLGCSPPRLQITWLSPRTPAESHVHHRPAGRPHGHPGLVLPSLLPSCSCACPRAGEPEAPTAAPSSPPLPNGFSAPRRTAFPPQFATTGQRARNPLISSQLQAGCCSQQHNTAVTVPQSPWHWRVPCSRGQHPALPARGDELS